jgi:hypothetical protein
LQTFDNNTREIISDVLIIRFIGYLKRDVLELAVHCECEEFVSMSIVQNVITSIFYGEKYDEADLVSSFNIFKKYQYNVYKNSTRFTFKSMEEKKLRACQKKNNARANYA